MPSASDRTPSITSSPSSGRRIFSAIASPFKSKSRAVAEFTVEPDHPHKAYGPGDVVTGSVRVRVVKPVRVTHITVCLHGYVQVFKNSGSPGESPKAGGGGYFATGRAKKSGGEYFGNGFASLFEDELVLCGDGRLGEGSYQFNFELEFPDRDLPSAITFERGTICYMITATITRPTTMSPTMTCERIIDYTERIDISPLEPPKPRTITLEPVSKRSRAKHQARKVVEQAERRSRKGESNKTDSDPHRTSEGSSDPVSQDSGQPVPSTPISPTRSEISLDTTTDSQYQGSQPDSQHHRSSGISDGNTTNTSKGSLGSKVINATIESMVGGGLRGSYIPVRVNISHTKHIKSLYGAIVTLYRQARVDMHPAIPLGPMEKGQGSKYEDYYPKSKTGLGGLSLSGSGSNHVFRKDLTQVMMPLVIDPNALTAEINAKVRVPDEAFPTISTVPGGMISFKYYVEVVLDIQGKLTGQDRSIASLGSAGPAGHILQNEGGSDMQRSAFTPFGSTIIDTASVRRDKSVVSCSFEVIVGTDNSERRKGKQRAEPVAETESSPVRVDQPVHNHEHQAVHNGRDWYDTGAHHDPYWYQHDPCQGQAHGPEAYSQHYAYHDYGSPQSYEAPPPLVPIPSLPDESQLSEKERIQRAEARLLPSQPPEDPQNQEPDASAGATAPYLPEESGSSNGIDSWPSVPAYEPAASGSGTNGPATPVAAPGQPVTMQHFPDVPEYEPPTAGSSSAVATSGTDDKQELRRRQLESEASGPPADDDNDNDAELARVPESAPSAPTLLAEGSDTNDSHAEATGAHGLPQYER